MSDAYQDHVTKFLCVFDSVAPIRTLRVKSNTKPWFDIRVSNSVQNHDKHYKNSNNEARKLKKAILNMQSFYFEETFAESKNNPTELWTTLKPLGISSKRGGNLKHH